MIEVVYFLSYDLINQKDYPKLIDEIKRFKAQRVLKSVWCFKYKSGKSSELRDHFKKFIDNDDKLLVVESGNNWATYKTDSNPHNL